MDLFSGRVKHKDVKKAIEKAEGHKRIYIGKKPRSSIVGFYICVGENDYKEVWEAALMEEFDKIYTPTKPEAEWHPFLYCLSVPLYEKTKKYADDGGWFKEEAGLLLGNHRLRGMSVGCSIGDAPSGDTPPPDL